MTDPRPPVDPDEAAAHAEALRALARRLVRDGGAAEDVAQEAWFVALEGARRGDVPLRWWLRGVARNVARHFRRDAATRQRHEAAAARPEAFVPEDSPVERADVHRRLLAAVLALDEPYRTTVLLRYVHGLSSAEIARRDGVPDGTVRSRLKRGLDTLRERLDRESPAGRRGWALVVAPFGFAGGVRAAPGVLAAAPAGAVAAAAAVLLLVGGGAAIAWHTGASDAAITGATDAASAPRSGTSGTGVAAAAPRARARARDAAAAETAAPDRADDDTSLSRDFTGVVIGDGDAPISGATVRIVTMPPDDAPSAEPDLRAFTTGPDGSFACPPGGWTPDTDAFAVVDREGVATLCEIAPGAPARISLSGGTPWRFRVVNGVDAPIRNAVALVVIERKPKTVFALAIAAADASGWTTVSVDAQTDVMVRAPGFAPRRFAAEPRPARVELRRRLHVAGKVVDDSDRLIPGVHVSCGDAVIVCPTGRFQFDELELDEAPDDVEVSAWCDGFATGEVATGPGDESVVIRLVRGRDVRVTAVREGGVPVPGASVGVFNERCATDRSGVGTVRGIRTGQITVSGWVWSTSGSPEELPELLGEEKLTLPEGTGPFAVTLELRPPAASYLPVLVLSDSGVPCQNVSLSARFPDDWYNARGSTGEDGRWLIVHRSPAGTALSLRGVMRRRGNDDVEVQAWPIDAVTRATRDGPPFILRLPPVTRIQFDVADADGRALPDEVAVEIKGSGRAKTDPAVPRSVRAAAGETFTEVISAPGFVPRKVACVAPSEGVLHVPVQLDRECTVRGRVMDALGAPRVGARIEATWPDAVESRRTLTDADGRFVVTGVAPHGAQVVVMRRTDAVEASLDIALAPGEDRDVGDILLAGLVWVRGAVKDTKGRPAGGVEIIALNGAAPLRRKMLGPPGRSAADGTFELALPAGARGILVARRFDHGSSSIHFDSGRGRSGLALVFPPEARVVAVVEGPAPQVADLRFLADAGSSAAWEIDSEYRGHVELSGGRVRLRYELQGLGPGTLRLFAERAGRRWAFDVVAVAGEEREVVVRVE